MSGFTRSVPALFGLLLVPAAASSSGGVRKVSLEEAVGLASHIVVVRVAKPAEKAVGRGKHMFHQQRFTIEKVLFTTEKSPGDYAPGEPRIRVKAAIGFLGENSVTNIQVARIRERRGVRKIPIYHRLAADPPEPGDASRILLIGSYDRQLRSLVGVSDGQVSRKYEAKIKSLLKKRK